MNLGGLINAAGKGAKNFFSLAATSTQASRAEARVQKMETRIENLRQATVKSKDAGVRGTVKVSSSREILTNSLGKRQDMTRGTSLARVDTGASSSQGGFTLAAMPPKMPPMRPLGR